jgi:hypothetical protein
MADVVVREAARTDSPACLLAWAEGGWLPSCPPEDVGHTEAGDRVLRFILVRAVTGADEPAAPATPRWHLDTVVLRGPSDRGADA